ncbi:class I SAM-dependent methyltransferase [Spirosoma gilvum]
MFYFHKDRELYHQHQTLTTKYYVIPFIDAYKQILPDMQVLEVGSGEGGVLKAFIDKGCIGVGVEPDTHKIELACKMMAPEIYDGRAQFFVNNIYDTAIKSGFRSRFDLIVLKDVIEHIYDQEKCLALLKTFLKPNGLIYLGFPPWQMPFGGHQQICQSKFLSRLPYFHLLPRACYVGILQGFGQSPKGLLEIRDTGLSIEHFERIVFQSGYAVTAKQFFFINPIYEFKFNLKPRLLHPLLTKLPYLRNFVTTCAYYLIAPT